MKFFKTYLITMALGSSLLFSSCQKDLDYIVTDPNQPTGPDTAWVSSITAGMPVVALHQALQFEPVRDSFQLFFGATTAASLSNGLTLAMPGGSLWNTNNVPVSGTIYAETYHLKTKGDLIRMGVPTSWNNRPLVSGGALYLRLTRNDTVLHVNPQQFITITSPEAQPRQGMKVFFGNRVGLTEFNWEPSTDSINQVMMGNDFYNVISNQLDWINIDQVYDTTGQPVTRVAAAIPSNYTNANSVAFLVFDNFRTVLQLSANVSLRQFISAAVPGNQPATLVVLSRQGNDYYLGHTEFTISGSGTPTGTQTVSVMPVITSLPSILTYLNSL